MHELIERVSQLSPAKRALLKQKLKQQSSDGDKNRTLSADELAKQITALSPVKRALLQKRLGYGGLAVPQPATPRERLSLGALSAQVAKLSAAKRALLERRLRHKTPVAKILSKDSPSLEELAGRIANLSPAKRALLQKRLQHLLTAPVQSYAFDEISRRYNQLSPAKRALLEQKLKQFDTSGAQPDSKPETVSVEAQAAKTTSNWLDELPLEDFETPVWLKEEDSPQPDAAITPPPQPAVPTDADRHVPKTSRWLDSLRPTDQPITDAEEAKTSEATGMLAGISTILPAEKVSIPTPQRGQIDTLAQAANIFFAIATAKPQPVILPEPLSWREKLVGGALKAGLLFLFVIVIALPLLPGLQREVNNRIIPWTEPSDAAEDALDSQRRQLISEQLGIIDSREPGSVALVSFDYSTATQGEMQPLAEAIVGRLKGQGMRIVALSLEPEGAVIAQNTLNTILAERDQQDEYGVQVINLGFLPGQTAAIRNLATNPSALLNIPDFQGNIPLQQRPEWSDVQNLDQADIIITFADNPTTARWWIEQLAAAPPSDHERFLLAAVSATAEPFLRPYRDSEQLSGLIAGINGAAAIESGRNTFGPARQMIDSIGLATMIVVIIIAAGTIAGWMPSYLPPAEEEVETQPQPENPSDNHQQQD